MSNTFEDGYGEFNFHSDHSSVQAQLIVKRFDDLFWNYDFDIFNDKGPSSTSSYLIVNDEKIKKYIDPVAFVEYRFPNHT